MEIVGKLDYLNTKKSAQKQIFFLEIRKSQSLARKGLKARRMKKGKEAHRENKIYEKIEML